MPSSFRSNRLLAATFFSALVGCADSPSAPPVCGNGVLETDEVCDDGNTLAGDGCIQCLPERGYLCAPDGSCTTLCGDLIVAGQEACDTGLFVRGYSDPYCADDCSAVVGACGDGIVQRLRESCDDTNQDLADGCNVCHPSFGFTCDGATNTCDASTVTPTATGQTLDAGETAALCTWFLQTLGGSGTFLSCYTGLFAVDTQDECEAQIGPWLGTCTVEGFERWVATKASACGVYDSLDSMRCL